MDDLNLRHVTPAFRTFCGDTALGALPRELARVGASRAVVVSVDVMGNHPEAMDRLYTALGDRFAGEFTGVQEHSPLPSVTAARDFLADRGADAVIAVGGGSAVVTARAATILLGEAKPIEELCTRRTDSGKLVSPKLTAAKLPQWVVPTTPTSAYAKAGAAVRVPGSGERLALYDPKARAQGVMLDPVMAGTAPPRLVWSAALNVFSMAVEGLQSTLVDPLADALLSQSLRTVIEWLPRLQHEPDSAQPRLQLMLGALMSGQGSDFTGGGLAQALSHAIGPRSSAPNGVVEALILPHALRYNADVVGHRADVLTRLLGIEATHPEAIVAEIQRLLGLFEVPTRLRDIGVSPEGLVQVVEHAMDDWAITASPRVPDEDDLMQLLNEAY